MRSDRVLVVDDDAIIADTLAMMVEDMGLETCGTAESAADAVELARRWHPDLVLMDMRLKGEGDGVDAARAIGAEIGCPILFITGSGEPETLARIGSARPAGLLIKPVTAELLRSEIRRILAPRRDGPRGGPGGVPGGGSGRTPSPPPG